MEMKVLVRMRVRVTNPLTPAITISCWTNPGEPQTTPPRMFLVTVVSSGRAGTVSSTVGNPSRCLRGAWRKKCVARTLRCGSSVVIPGYETEWSPERCVETGKTTAVCSNLLPFKWKRVGETTTCTSLLNRQLAIWHIVQVRHDAHGFSEKFEDGLFIYKLLTIPHAFRY